MNGARNWLRMQATTRPAHPALLFAGEAISFAELAGRASAIAMRLKRHRVRPRSVVATLVASRPELVALAHAIPGSGAIWAPLGIRASAAELTEMLDRCAARTLICDASTRATVAALRPRRPVTCIDIDDESATTPQNLDPEQNDTRPIGGEDTHTIVFTSGSSGRPKAVRLTWNNHLWSAIATAANLGLRADDRWLCCLPLNHVGGLSILLRSAVFGHTVELHSRFDPLAANEAIERGTTIISVVANMLQRMLDARADRPYPATLRAVLAGGGPLPRALLERCRAARVPILPTYGLTETASQVVTASPTAPPIGAGRPLPFVELQIAGKGKLPAPPGVAGEILVRGPMVGPGPIGTRRRRPDDWLHTRDCGWIDEHGNLHVLGRMDETVISGGENIHPGEVERVLERHPAVLEAFAAGVDDSRWGQVIHAAVRVRAAIGEDELLGHCRKHLAGFKIPRRVCIISEFPRTPAGKIARAAAAEEIHRSHAMTQTHQSRRDAKSA